MAMATASSPAVTSTILLNLKDNTSININAQDPSSNKTPETQIFIELTDLVKAQEGFVSQCWGHQVEDAKIFVWSIDWQSLAHQTVFTTSPLYSSFLKKLDELSDLESANPLILTTHFSPNPSSTSTHAFLSPITEIAHMTLPSSPLTAPETKLKIERALDPIMHNVTTVGRATGAAIGWVTTPENDTLPAKQTITLHGVFGYHTLDDHMQWREEKEHAEAIEIMERLEREHGLDDSKHGVLRGRGMFHVVFRR